MVTGLGLTDGLVFDREEDALIRTASALDKEAIDSWVLVTHCGVETDKVLAAKFPRVPIILGGHSHTGLPEGFTHGGTGVRVYQSFGKASAITRVDVEFSRRTGQILSVKGGLVDLPIAQYPPDPDAARVAASFSGDIDRIMAQEMGELRTPLANRRGTVSSDLGNWITDCMRKAAGADVALHNKTGIRSELPAGRITRRHLFEVSPFGNTVVTMDLAGHQLLALLEKALEAERTTLEVSGMTLLVDLRHPPGSRIVEAKVGGAPIDPSAVYTVATNNFLADGGDGQSIFRQGARRVETGIVLLELTERCLRESSPLAYPPENRWRAVEGSVPEPAPGPRPGPAPENPPGPEIAVPPPAPEPPGVGIALPLGEPEPESAGPIGAVGETYRSRTGAAFETVVPFSEEERLENLRLLARRGTLGVVAAVGDGYARAVDAAAAEFGEIRFVLLDAPPGPAAPAVHAIELARDEAAFVLGAAAAWLAGERRVALLVGAEGPESEAVRRGFLAGWTHAGGAAPGPSVVAVSDSAAGYEDPALVEKTATVVVDGGAGVVVHFVGRGAAGVERVAGSKGAISLGFGDPTAGAAPGVAARVRLRPDRALARALEEAAAGRLQAGRTRFRLADGLAEFQFLDPKIESRLDALVLDLNSGRVRVPESGR